MKAVYSMLALLGLVILSAFAAAQEKPKEVTLKGTLLCAKCVLKESKKCQTAIQVEEGGKTVTYYFLDKGHQEDYHEAVCGGEKKKGTVTGVVSEKDGKKYLTPKKVVYDK